MLPAFARSLKTLVRSAWGHRTYSQEGEDRILERIFEKKCVGFYVDIGAHHPYRFSNTYFFYRKGWRGINIDAAPGSMRPFRVLRPRDIQVEVGIAERPQTAKFFIFNEPALNTFDEPLAMSRNVSPWKIVKTETVAIRPLRDVLMDHLPAGQDIDFMSIDVEGLDFNVLMSNDWDRFRPKVVLVETLGSDLIDLTNDPSAALLASLGYRLFAKTVHTSIFMCSKVSDHQ